MAFGRLRTLRNVCLNSIDTVINCGSHVILH